MSGGYATQRLADHSPGTSSSESQNLDYAVLYFSEEAGRGGVAGFLASDSAANEFLLSGAQKLLVGYPVDGFAAADQGRMHATAPANLPFTQGFGRTYTTTGIHSSGGNSGGPLCVRHANGKYYPAAIYLGGSSQTVVRAIDSAVVDLITRAEVSANGGVNNTGGRSRTPASLHSVPPISGSDPRDHRARSCPDCRSRLASQPGNQLPPERGAKRQPDAGDLNTSVLFNRWLP